MNTPDPCSFAVDYLTDLVEEAVYKEFEAISERGGGLGAMDTMYQRGKIQHAGDIVTEIELIRGTPEEKGQQIANVAAFVGAASAAIALPTDRLTTLQQTARDRPNVFTALMEAVKTHSLGQISHALYEVGGEYRRNM